MVLKWIYVYLSALTSAISSFMLLGFFFFSGGCSDGGNRRVGEIWNSDHGVDSLSVFRRESEWWRERGREREKGGGGDVSIFWVVFLRARGTNRGEGGGREIGGRESTWVSLWVWLFVHVYACMHVCASVIVDVVCVCERVCPSETVLTVGCTCSVVLKQVL